MLFHSRDVALQCWWHPLSLFLIWNLASNPSWRCRQWQHLTLMLSSQVFSVYFPVPANKYFVEHKQRCLCCTWRVFYRIYQGRSRDWQSRCRRLVLLKVDNGEPRYVWTEREVEPTEVTPLGEDIGSLSCFVCFLIQVTNRWTQRRERKTQESDKSQCW